MSLLTLKIEKLLLDKNKVYNTLKSGKWEIISKDDIFELIQQLKTDHKHDIFELADKIRQIYMGDEIFIRSIIEFSNHCKRQCAYCGINSLNKNVIRYRIPIEEIIETCIKIKKRGHTTVVLQSGEDFYYTDEMIASLLREIKDKTGLAITVSVGERPERVYKMWKHAGMDRYLMRFETSNEKLYLQMHPESNLTERLDSIRVLKKINVQTGSGFLIGLPGQSEEDIVNDISLCRSLDLDMIGIGPFIAHPETDLSGMDSNLSLDYLTGIMSILRIVNFDAHIPATTAFDAIDKSEGRQKCLKRGANIFMPNATPQKYREKYQLYPGKPCINESGSDCAGCVALRVKSIGRVFGTGPGHSKHVSIWG